MRSNKYRVKRFEINIKLSLVQPLFTSKISWISDWNCYGYASCKTKMNMRITHRVSRNTGSFSCIKYHTIPDKWWIFSIYPLLICVALHSKWITNWFGKYQITKSCYFYERLINLLFCFWVIISILIMLWKISLE